MELEEFTKPIDARINHKQATFDLSDESHPYHLESTFDAIIIAGVKQRIMWPPFGAENRSPMCKSSDNVTGFPQAGFPWQDSRSTSLSGLRPVEVNNLECASCEFKDDPQKYKSQGMPVCESGYKLVLMDGSGQLIILNCMNMAAKRVVAHYGEWFKNNKLPTFCYVTRFELQGVKKNGNRYADLELTKQAQTDRNLWVPRYLPLHNEWKRTLEVAPTSMPPRSVVELPVL